MAADVAMRATRIVLIAKWPGSARKWAWLKQSEIAMVQCEDRRRASRPSVGEMRIVKGLFLSLALGLAGSMPLWAGSVRIYPAPEGEPLSKDYSVKVEGQPVPVYVAKVAAAEPALRWKAMDDKAHSADFFTNAAFTYFDITGTVSVTVTCPEPIRSVELLPSSFKLAPTVKGNTLTFSLTKPGPITIEVNGNWVSALHVFANPPET